MQPASIQGEVPPGLAQAILTDLPSPVLICDLDGRITFANAAVVARLATDPEDLLGMPLGSIAPEFVQSSWQSFVSALRAGTLMPSYTHLRAVDGRWYQAELTAQLVPYGGSEVCVVLMHELSGQQGLMPLQQFAQFVIEKLPDAVYWIRDDGTFLYVNAAACQMLGYSRSELQSMSIFDINPSLDPERWEPLWQALLTQGRRIFRSAHKSKEGRLLQVEIDSNVFALEGETFSCSFARDDTDKRKAEEALQRDHDFVESLIATAPVMVHVRDSQGRIERFNRCAEQATGYSLEELRGKHWVDTVVPPAERAEVSAWLSQSMSGATMLGVICPIVTKTGEERHVLWHDQLLTDPASGGVRLLAIGQDITEQRNLEQRLRQAEKLEAIGRLAGGVAHDFNNQLAGIMGWTEILRRELDNPTTVGECAEHIMTALRRASDLTSQLLAYARKGKYVTKTVDTHDVVREVIGILQHRIDKRISIETELRAQVSTTKGDPTQLGNAVLNLGINACDAMPNGGSLTFATRVIKLDATEVAGSPYEVDPGEFVELTVSDTGTGIDERTQQHMFEPFFTTKAEGRGTGMGLAAVYGTVKSHRGMIFVSSSIGLGTSIRMRLPVTRAPPEGKASEASSRELGATRLRVLLVDDEAVVRDVTTRLLVRLGCQVTSFDNGFDAIKHYREAWQSVDVVMLDMVMPLLDGKATYQAIRAVNPAVSVILVSGYSVDGDAESLLAEGATDFVQKPFRLSNLEAALDGVRKWLRQAPQSSS